ncbi:hypothetical protein KY332_02815 [Candidatus Woesearchaeota archaeon]|nr:hypothetical protein [Candidatus Woesearchaeota archaeon]
MADTLNTRYFWTVLDNVEQLLNIEALHSEYSSLEQQYGKIEPKVASFKKGPSFSDVSETVKKAFKEHISENPQVIPKKDKRGLKEYISERIENNEKISLDVLEKEYDIAKRTYKSNVLGTSPVNVFREAVKDYNHWLGDEEKLKEPLKTSKTLESRMYEIEIKPEFEPDYRRIGGFSLDDLRDLQERARSEKEKTWKRTEVKKHELDTELLKFIRAAFVFKKMPGYLTRSKNEKNYETLRSFYPSE